jgi:hypothetical protein
MLYRLLLLFFALPALGRDGDIVLAHAGKVIELDPVRHSRQP